MLEPASIQLGHRVLTWTPPNPAVVEDLFSILANHGLGTARWAALVVGLDRGPKSWLASIKCADGALADRAQNFSLVLAGLKPEDRRKAAAAASERWLACVQFHTSLWGEVEEAGKNSDPTEESPNG